MGETSGGTPGIKIAKRLLLRWRATTRNLSTWACKTGDVGNMKRQWLIPAFCIGLMIFLAAGSPAATGQTARAVAGNAVSSNGSPDTASANPTFLELLRKGGPVMYPLYLCSFLMVAFAIERAISLRRRKVSPQETADPIRAATAPGSATMDVQGLLDRLQLQANPLARIAKAGLSRADRPILEVEKAVEDAAAKEVAGLQRNNRVLSSVASVAPLLGLLGTVTGIIRTFMTVARDEEALGRTARLAGGIYEALVATAVGLFIAITALVLYYFFQERVDRLVAEIDGLMTGLLEKLQVREKK